MTCRALVKELEELVEESQVRRITELGNAAKQQASCNRVVIKNLSTILFNNCGEFTGNVKKLPDRAVVVGFEDQSFAVAGANGFVNLGTADGV